MKNEIIQQNKKEITPANRMKVITNNIQVQEMFKNSLGENSGAFLSSLIELYSDPTGTLQNCPANEVMMEALKAATLKLPINKNLGFAYIIPFNKSELVNGNWIKKQHPQFQIGYKGFIQLAMRTGQYKTINSNVVYEGMNITEDYLTGEIKITGQKQNDNIIGFFSYFKLINGFEKVVYWTKEQVIEHALNNSQGYQSMIKAQQNKNYKSDKFVWDSNFNEMALKTVTKRLLSKFGVLSTELQNAIVQETDTQIEAEMAENANAKELPLDEIEEVEYEEIEEVDEQIEIQDVIEAAPF